MRKEGTRERERSSFPNQYFMAYLLSHDNDNQKLRSIYLCTLDDARVAMCALGKPIAEIARLPPLQFFPASFMRLVRENPSLAVPLFANSFCSSPSFCKQALSLA